MCSSSLLSFFPSNLFLPFIGYFLRAKVPSEDALHRSRWQALHKSSRKDWNGIILSSLREGVTQEEIKDDGFSSWKQSIYFLLILPGGESFPQTLLHDSSLSTETLVQLTTKQIFAEHLLGGNLALYELLNWRAVFRRSLASGNPKARGTDQQMGNSSDFKRNSCMLC